jgi:glutathione S-transferase
MPEFVVHTVPGSPFARAVLATLIEKGAPWRLSPMTLGANRTPEHLARHPFGRVPVVEHGDFTLYETAAILRYIDRVLPDPPLTPSDPRAAARMDQIMSINDWYLFQGVNNVIGFQRVVGPTLMGLTPNEDVIAAAMPQAHRVFAALTDLLADQDFFAGPRLSLADLTLIPHMDFLAQTPEWAKLTDGRTNLVAWLSRVNARASVQATTMVRVMAMAQAAAIADQE